MFMNKLLEHLLIQCLKVLMEQYLHMVKQEQEKHLLWKVYCSQPELRGIIPSSFAHIFDSISHSKSRQFLVRASYLEIYNVNINLF